LKWNALPLSSTISILSCFKLVKDCHIAFSSFFRINSPSFLLLPSCSNPWVSHDKRLTKRERSYMMTLRRCTARHHRHTYNGIASRQRASRQGRTHLQDDIILKYSLKRHSYHIFKQQLRFSGIGSNRRSRIFQVLYSHRDFWIRMDVRL
jgi:hypothetical protein